LNRLGFGNPLGKVNVRFEIEEGDNLIELTGITTESVTVRSKRIEGEAIVAVYSLRSGVMISKVLIKILPLGKA
jgi:uracil phosphoribosyltransferase